MLSPLRDDTKARRRQFLPGAHRSYGRSDSAAISHSAFPAEPVANESNQQIPDDIAEEDLRRDFKAEIRQLIYQMRDLSEREAMDQVYRSLVLYLCNPCYLQWIENPVDLGP